MKSACKSRWKRPGVFGGLRCCGVEPVQDAEDWMNRRIRRSISLRPYCAPYIGTYADDALRAKSGTRTLVWDLKVRSPGVQDARARTVAG